MKNKANDKKSVHANHPNYGMETNRTYLQSNFHKEESAREGAALYQSDESTGGNDSTDLFSKSQTLHPLSGKESYPLLPHKRQGEYTAADREMLPEDVRTELIHGVLYDMAAPKPTHQIISTELLYQIRAQIEKCGEACLVFAAPSDVWLLKDDRTIVQPDIYVICDYDMFGENDYANGAPPFVAEILSPSTRSKDIILKEHLYREAGVSEYWIIDPEKSEIHVYEYGENGTDRRQTSYTFQDDVPIGISDGRCTVNLRYAESILTRLRERK